jgi:hypothetical protein
MPIASPEGYPEILDRCSHRGVVVTWVAKPPCHLRPTRRLAARMHNRADLGQMDLEVRVVDPLTRHTVLTTAAERQETATQRRCATGSTASSANFAAALITGQNYREARAFALYGGRQRPRCAAR